LTEICNGLTERFDLGIPACNIDMGTSGDLRILVQFVNELLSTLEVSIGDKDFDATTLLGVEFF
jgi:hypothetical protein